VHPNYLDEDFYRANHGDQPMLLTSNPFDLAAIKAWAQQPAHETICGTLAGEELLVIFKN
jgi:hypothetical protein